MTVNTLLCAIMQLKFSPLFDHVSVGPSTVLWIIFAKYFCKTFKFSALEIVFIFSFWMPLYGNSKKWFIQKECLNDCVKVWNFISGLVSVILSNVESTNTFFRVKISDSILGRWKFLIKARDYINVELVKSLQIINRNKAKKILETEFYGKILTYE